MLEYVFKMEQKKMALSSFLKEKLEKIKLPLSDDDYVKIHDVWEVNEYDLWEMGELAYAYFGMKYHIFCQRFPGNKCRADEVCWFPPPTLEYLNHPVNVRYREMMDMIAFVMSKDTQFMERLMKLEMDIHRKDNNYVDYSHGTLTEEELKNIKLPLSDADYVRIHDSKNKAEHLLENVSKELDEAYNDKMADIFFQIHPKEPVGWEDITWYPPQTEEFKNHPINISIRNNREKFIRMEAKKLEPFPLSEEDYADTIR